MKKTLLTVAIVAFLMGSFYTSASAMETKNTINREIVAGDDQDKLLDEYEKIIDQYVKLYKKVMSGDEAAMNEYVKLAEKAEQLSEKMLKATEELTPAQLKRLESLTDKMAKAIKH